MTVRLLPLDCPSCGSAMRGEPFDVLFLCAHCGAGAVVEGGDRLEPVESVALLPAAGRRAETWRPGWLLEADVRVSERVVHGGRPTPGWSQRRTFVIPAFELPLLRLVRWADALARVAAGTGAVPREPVRGGVLARADARTLARFVVLRWEVARPDDLASVEVAVEPVAWRLAALPLERHGQGYRCAVTGVTV